MYDMLRIHKDVRSASYKDTNMEGEVCQKLVFLLIKAEDHNAKQLRTCRVYISRERSSFGGTSARLSSLLSDSREEFSEIRRAVFRTRRASC